jgi:hypothetical protein
MHQLLWTFKLTVIFLLQVRHKSTQKVYAMKLLSKFEMVRWLLFQIMRLLNLSQSVKLFSCFSPPLARLLSCKCLEMEIYEAVILPYFVWVWSLVCHANGRALRVLKRIFRRKSKGVTEDWKKLYKKEPRNLCWSSNPVRRSNSKEMTIWGM